MPRLKIGISLSTTGQIEGVKDRARHVEQLGFDSLWVPDLINGDGTPSLESIVTLTTAAAVTDRVQLGFGVLVPYARPIALLAAQIVTLQYLSGNRLILGIGSGGPSDTPFSRAVGAVVRERGRRTDAALDILPHLIAGEATQLTGEPDQPVLTLAPAVPVPPFLIGGSSDVAIRRAATRGFGWFPSLITPDALTRQAEKLRELASEHGHATPGITVGGHILLESEKAEHEAFLHNMVDNYGIPPETAAKIPITGPRELVAERFAAYAEAGAERLVIALSAKKWMQKCELIKEALDLLN
ncbi:LLM class flavin-dependent oxidoreductase [Ktedonosporobacter rubrisoli]|nr:LLM class flavin-dependent oxidoreductase [Ktedonosporobacter rubrisoli]